MTNNEEEVRKTAVALVDKLFKIKEAFSTIDGFALNPFSPSNRLISFNRDYFQKVDNSLKLLLSNMKYSESLVKRFSQTQDRVTIEELQESDRYVSNAFGNWLDTLKEIANEENVYFDPSKFDNLRYADHEKPSHKVAGGSGSEGKLEAPLRGIV